MRNWLKSLFSFGGTGGHAMGPAFSMLPGAHFDYRREAGALWDNSIVLACVKWACRTFPEATLRVERREGERWTVVPDHPAEQLVNRPNRFYDASVLWSGAILSYMIDGNAYWYANPSKLGTPAELYTLPHFSVSPQWPENGSVYISHYLYRPDGVRSVQLDPKHVVHFRNGIDPRNTRRGLSDLGAALREVCADNEASTAAAALMRNMGVVGISFTPATDVALTEAQRERLAALGQQKFSGERRGEIFVASLPGKFETIGWAPQQMAMDAVRRVPEERITALLGIPAVVVGLGAGLNRSTYSNYKEARESAYESFLVPMWKRFAEQLTLQLMPLFGEDPMQCRFFFDTSRVRVLQEDETDRADRIATLFKSGVITLEEARALVGL